MQRILVTGGAGFIGSCLVRQWLQEGPSELQLVVLDRLTYAGNLDSLASVLDDPRLTFCEGDIANVALVEQLSRQHRVQGVVHLAAESHVDRSIDGPAAFVATNVAGTCSLLEGVLAYWQTLPPDAATAFRFLQVSTDEVYGSLGPTGKFNEQSRYRPNSPYAASKAAADHFVRAFAQTYGLPTLLTHCSNNYGPCQFPEKLIPLMILNAVEGKRLPIYGDGQQVRDWIHVDDHCRALRTVLERGVPGEVYDIGGDCERSNLEVVTALCALIDEYRPALPHRPTDQLIEFVTDRPGHDRRYAIDSSKLCRELQWQPLHSFTSGLRQTVDWYLNNEDWVARVSSGAYRRERLGLNRHNP